MAGKRGRPSTYTDAAATEICQRLADGEPLRQICRDEHMPPWRTVYQWMEDNADFAARIARARDLGFDAIAEDTIEMIDAAPERFETIGGTRIDPAAVQWQKNRVEQRLKLLAKWSPKKYGERVQVDARVSKTAEELTDDELAHLAAGSGGRTAEAQEGKGETGALH